MTWVTVICPFLLSNPEFKLGNQIAAICLPAQLVILTCVVLDCFFHIFTKRISDYLVKFYFICQYNLFIMECLKCNRQGLTIQINTRYCENYTNLFYGHTGSAS